MGLHHPTSGEVVSIANLEPRGKTRSLIKTGALQVIRIALAAGESLPPHTAPGEMTFHCLSGSFAFSIGMTQTLLNPGDWLFLEAGREHAVEAREDALALVTISLAGS